MAKQSTKFVYTNRGYSVHTASGCWGFGVSSQGSLASSINGKHGDTNCRLDIYDGNVWKTGIPRNEVLFSDAQYTFVTKLLIK